MNRAQAAWCVSLAAVLAVTWFFSVPSVAVTFDHPTPIHVELVEGYRIVTYREGLEDVEGFAGSLSFTANLIEAAEHKLGLLEWTVYEPTD